MPGRFQYRAGNRIAPESENEEVHHNLIALPYAVQARADMFFPQLYEDVRRLKGKGLPDTEIGDIG